ncbi:DNA-processing protein DprA [Aestuariivirga litoralis]|uniref:DNA-processing protein DprA n=1 Tax=Aestuariivirga litoralis TaxID=2650924 RepID=A0A2W2C6R3_9HYPH|nr:DNA-processing protein DprA [Aestuariivirga litoralis]PZF75833.1 DNA-processing protein DprA [Aestuariivirga litoralis]
MIEISAKTRVLLALSMLRGVGPAALRKVAAVSEFEVLSRKDLACHLPRSAAAGIGEGAWVQAEREADKQVNLAVAAGARIISSADLGYPQLLMSTRDDPQILFVKGCLANVPEKSVAIIGTREPTDHGMLIAQRLAAFFAGEGWSVVSGLAIGCDAAAHEAAIDVGGHTVAVMAHGLQTVAPSRHRALAQRILDCGGALIAEYPFGQEPLPANFVKRDRIQAGLAQGVVMVQSDLTGGSLHASRAAISYGRWLAVPYPTEQDIQRSEIKIQGNLLLADGSPTEKVALLRCDERDLRRLIILRSRNDYTLLVESTDVKEPPRMPPVQGQLL